MIEQLDSIKQEALGLLDGISDVKDLEAWRVKYLGKKSPLTQILRGLAQLPIDERKAVGAYANHLLTAFQVGRDSDSFRERYVEIRAQKQLMALYEEAPVLVELEKMRMEYEHQERLATLQMDAYLKAFEAVAPGIRVNIYGSGNQTSKIFTDLMSFTHGLRLLGEEVPVIGNLIDGSSNGNGSGFQISKLSAFMPGALKVRLKHFRCGALRILHPTCMTADA